MSFEKIQITVMSPKFLACVIVIVFAVCVDIIMRKLSKRSPFHNSSFIAKHATGVQISASLVRFSIYLVGFMLILQIYGVNIGSLATSLGIATAIVAFAIQDILKDIIMGANMITGSFFSVGDVIKYGEITGVVREFNMRYTKVFDLGTGGIVSISNRNITEIQVLSDWLDIVLPTSYEENAPEMRELFKEICVAIEGIENVTSCDFLRTDAFSPSSVDYRIRVHCPPDRQAVTRRAALGIIQDKYAEHGVAIPFNQLDVHIDGAK